MEGALPKWRLPSGYDALYRWNSTHSDFGFPRGVRGLPLNGHINAELGVDDLWLPVTRTKTKQDRLQVGVWFHYARGCSDFAWPVGRTLLVRNKCEAACLLEQMLADDISDMRTNSWAVAVSRAARKLIDAAKRPAFLRAWSLWWSRHREVLPANYSHEEMETALHLCAHGRADPARMPNASSILKQMLAASALDYVSAASLVELRTRPRPIVFDTIQFSNMCADHTWPGCGRNVEIWDVRALQGANLTGLRGAAVAYDTREQLHKEYIASRMYRKPSDLFNAKDLEKVREAARQEATKRWRAGSSVALHRSVNGSACHLSDSWDYCVACADSESERACNFQCRYTTKKGGRKVYSYEPRLIGIEVSNSSPPYGTPYQDRSDHGFFRQGGADAVGPAAIGSVWQWEWGPMVGAVLGFPALP